MGSMVRIKISLADVNNLTIGSGKGRGRGATELAIENKVFKDISRRTANTIEPLNHILVKDPKTKLVTNKSLAPLVDAANRYLGDMLSTIGTTLNSRTTFSNFLHKGRRVRLTMDGTPVVDNTALTNMGWPDLSDKYLHSIGLMKQVKGSYRYTGPVAGKTFWYERRRAGSPRLRTRNPSKAVGLNADYALDDLAEIMRKPSPKQVKSILGKVNKFTAGVDVSLNSVKGNPRRSYGRADGTVVLAVKGSINGPTKLSLGGAPLEEDFSRIITQSFQNGVNGGTRPALVGEVGPNGEDYWLYNLLKNEGRRGWMRAYSVRSGSKFVTWMGKEARKLQDAK